MNIYLIAIGIIALAIFLSYAIPFEKFGLGGAFN